MMLLSLASSWSLLLTSSLAGRIPSLNIALILTLSFLRFIILFFYYVWVCLYEGVQVCILGGGVIHVIQCPGSPEEGIGLPGAGAIGSGEPPNVSAGN